MELAEIRSARYAILQADLEEGLTPLGVLLEDPVSDRLHVRLRRDWDRIAGEDPVLPLLEEDFRAKAEQQGAGKLFEWIEGSLSANLRTTDREAVAVENFDRALNRLYARHVPTPVTKTTHIPLWSLKAAAGRFLDNDEVEPEGWLEAPPELARVTEDLFAAGIEGSSMEPDIPNGSVCLFRHGVTGSRTGRLVLVEELGRGSNDRYTVKRYRSVKSRSGDEWKQERIILEPLNPAHQAFELEADDARFRVIAEFLRVLY
jgi:phage repressor protein C with HTH and peptisase S24 domain